MMFDYLMAWANDEKLKPEGVVAFIGADDKAFCSDQSVILSSTENKKGCKDIGNDGVRQAGGDGREAEKKTDEKSKFQDEDRERQGKENCFNWEGGLRWTGKCTDWEHWKSKVQVGQMYGLTSSNAAGFKKLKELVVHI